MDSYLDQRQFWRLCGLLLLKCAMKNKIKNVKFRAVLEGEEWFHVKKRSLRGY